jgi:GDPmannose 4,6-dehydratase
MRCLVIGGSGQDGVLISAQLLAEGHRVTTVARRPGPLASTDHRTLDVSDHAALAGLVAEVRPDEIYYLAAHHRSSQDGPPPLDADIAGSLAVNASSFAALLAAVERHAPAARTVYASSCRVFGLGDGSLLDETAPRAPICAYGISKAAGMGVADLYRRERGLFVASAVLFNHESELRPTGFLSKKLALAALAARTDPAIRVTVGSLDDAADWQSARDAAAAMRAMLRADRAEDFIVASGRSHTVRDFAAACFDAVGLDWTRHVVPTPAEGRPRWRLIGDSTKLTSRTGWRPSLEFEVMVRDLVARTDRHERQRPADFHPYL